MNNKIIAPASELFIYRSMLMVGVIAFPMFLCIVRMVAPGGVDYMSHRLFIAGVWALTVILSFVHPFVKKNLIVISCWHILILHLWVIWIVSVNHFSVEYFIGMLTSLSALNIAARIPRLLYPFLLVSYIYTVIAALLHPAPVIPTSMVIFSVTIVSIVFALTSQALVINQRKISILNQTLEKKVAERTAVAENRMKKLTHKNRELEQFAYIASHDLKSPLRNIGSFVQLIQRNLKNGSNREDIGEYLDFVVKAVAKMNAIVDDVLRYSRFGDASLQFQSIDSQELIAESCLLLQQEIHRKNAVIQFDNMVSRVVCDEKQMEQLLRNLVENALKYNKSPRPTIIISIQERSSDFLFSMKDNGIGIPVEYQEKIFKIFQRLHTDQEYTGTGVGLGICKRIIENHQGKIWIESVPEEGATFYFTIRKNLVSPAYHDAAYHGSVAAN